MARLPLQFLDPQQAIADSEGRPTEYFLRALLGDKDNIEQAADDAATVAEQLPLKADKVTQIIAGTGLSGGGTLEADRTLEIDMVAEAERVRDVVGAALVAGANITITINDAGDTVTIAASGGGGGGGGAWTEVDVWDFAVDGAVASYDVDVSAYNDIFVLCHHVTMSASSWRAFQVSVDGGATFKSTTGDYVRRSTSGATDTNDDRIYFHSNGASAARSGRVDMNNIRSTAPKGFVSTAGNGGANYWTEFTGAITHLRIGAYTGTFTGGAVRVFGR